VLRRLLAVAQRLGLLQESLSGLSLHQFLAMHCREGLLTSQVTAAVGVLSRAR
jgi:hypothetical protein